MAIGNGRAGWRGRDGQPGDGSTHAGVSAQAEPAGASPIDNTPAEAGDCGLCLSAVLRGEPHDDEDAVVGLFLRAPRRRRSATPLAGQGLRPTVDSSILIYRVEVDAHGEGAHDDARESRPGPLSCAPGSSHPAAASPASPQCHGGSVARPRRCGRGNDERSARASLTGHRSVGVVTATPRDSARAGRGVVVSAGQGGAVRYFTDVGPDRGPLLLRHRAR